MAEQLDDGEFWLPSQFLTDDDILSDFKSDGFGSGFGSGSSSDLGSLTTETETSDDDDLLLSGLTRPVKTAVLSGSPQSTLYGWELTQQGSSHDSPTGPIELPKNNDDDNNDNNATLDLLNKAAGEVAKMKLRTERSSTGTGFFDCSNSAKGLFCPPQRPPPMFTPPFYPHSQFRRFPPHMMWGPVQLPPPPPPQQRQTQNKPTKNTATTTKNNNNKTASNNRPLGLPPSAWPPLPGQAQSQPPQPQVQSQAQPQPPKVQSMMGMYVGQQITSVGTGVFLPRQVTIPVPEPKMKPEVNLMKTRNKASQRRNTRPVTRSNDDEIKLPSEWVY